MLSQKEQKIIIDRFKPLKPSQLGFGFYDKQTKELELFYTVHESKGYFQLMNIIADIEKTLNLKIDITSFDYLNLLEQKQSIKKENIFFNDQNQSSRLGEIATH